jgi:GNAT superfamily N-acetyltransferase
MTKPRLTLSVDEKPRDRDVEKVIAGLRAFNAEQTGRPLNKREFAVWVKDGRGRIVGGLTAILYWDWMYVDYLWLSDAARKRGLGRKLMEKAERIAVRRGCAGAWLDTFSFQAPGFYRHMGYTEFGRCDGHPTGHTRHFFAKRLARTKRRKAATRRATPRTRP